MLIVALYMNDVPAPAAQVIVLNAQWTFLLGWKPDYRAITHHTVHSQSISMRLYLGFPHYLVNGNIDVRQFLQVSEVSSFCRFPRNPSFFPATSFPVFCPLGTRLWHQWLSWHRGPGQKRSHMPLNPSSRGAQQISLVGVYEPPCPMLLFTMISAFISRQTSACPLLAYNTKLKSLNEE